MTTPHEPGTPRDRPAGLRHNRDFQRLWIGQVLSSTGSSMATIVYPLLAFAATGSAAQAGLVAFAGLAAAALVRLPAGVLADRYPLKPLMIIPDLVRAAITSSVAVAVLTGHLSLGLLIAVTVIGSACGAVFDSAQTVAIRHVVTPAQLPQAFAQDAARGHIATLAGPPAGGYLYSLAAALPVLADAVSYLVCTVLTARVRAPLRPSRSDEAPASMRREITVGLKYVLSSPFLRTTLACAVGFNAVFASLTVAVIAITDPSGAGHGPGGAVGLGAALSMGAAGGILGAWAAPALGRRLSPAAVVYLFGWSSTAGLLLLGQVQGTYLIGLLLAVMFFFATPANATLFAEQVSITPPHLQGRVISAAVLSAGIAAPVGPPLAGLLLDTAGQAVTFSAVAALAATLTIVLHLSPSVRAMPRPGNR